MPKYTFIGNVAISADIDADTKEQAEQILDNLLDQIPRSAEGLFGSLDFSYDVPEGDWGWDDEE